jgi:hypothetical protein
MPCLLRVRHRRLSGRDADRESTPSGWKGKILVQLNAAVISLTMGFM